MTTPRGPGGPHGRDPYDPEPYGSNRRPDRSEGTAAWGRPPAGGWGAPAHDLPGAGYDRGAYESSPGPYGSEPQYGWQQPGYEPSWGHDHPPTAPRRAAARNRGRRRLAVAVAAALAVVTLLVLGFVTPGWFVTRVFDGQAMQAGVAQILTEDYGTDGVVDVRCPEGVEVVPETTLRCDVTIDGDPVTVPVRVTDDDGGYEVGRPS